MSHCALLSPLLQTGRSHRIAAHPQWLTEHLKWGEWEPVGVALEASTAKCSCLPAAALLTLLHGTPEEGAVNREFLPFSSETVAGRACSNFCTPPARLPPCSCIPGIRHACLQTAPHLQRQAAARWPGFGCSSLAGRVAGAPAAELRRRLSKQTSCREGRTAWRLLSLPNVPYHPTADVSLVSLLIPFMAN